MAASIYDIVAGLHEIGAPLIITTMNQEKHSGYVNFAQRDFVIINEDPDNARYSLIHYNDIAQVAVDCIALSTGD